MNILVTGANGQLGTEMRLVSKKSKDHYFFSDVNKLSGLDTIYLDVTDLEAVQKMLNENEISIIVNCAAYTNVDAAEDNIDMADGLNHRAVKNLSEAIRARKGTLFHISTDYVFGKEPYNIPCKEEQKGTPTGVYGQTKLAGEHSILKSGCKYLIFRTAWLYSEYGKNFVKTMLKLISERDAVSVVFDQVGTPTYALDLAETIFDIIEKRKYVDKYGIYNYSNEGVCSWYDLTKMIAEYSGHNKCRVYPCHSNEYPSKVVRPSYSVLDKTKIKSTFGIDIPYWTDSLKKCLKNIDNLTIFK